MPRRCTGVNHSTLITTLFANFCHVSCCVCALLPQSRKEADELSKQYNLQPSAPASSSGASATQGSTSSADGSDSSSSASAQQLPDAVVLKMLKREVLLTSAKLHALTSDLLDGQRSISRLRSQIRHVSC